MTHRTAETASARKKQALLAGLIDVRARILNAAASLPAKSRSQIFLGTWNVRDLLAHLIGWDHTNLEAADEALQGRLPGFHQHADRDWRSYNATLVVRHGDQNFRRLLASARRSHRALLERVRALSTEEMWKDRGIRFRGWTVTIGGLLDAERRDEEKHWQQIVKFARSLPR